MRCGVQECIKNWVGRPTQEHRPNFRFLYPTIRISITRNRDGISIGILLPSQTWILGLAAWSSGYHYYSDLCKYSEYPGRAHPCKIKMESGMLSYEAEGGSNGYQRCGIKRPLQVVYNLHLNQKQLTVNVTGEQKRSKAYKVGPKSVEEGRQLFREIIRQLDQHVGIKI